MDRITKVFYINCWHRTDRRQQIEEELKNNFKYDKAERLDATVHARGIVGCTISHVRIMRRMIAEDWDTVMVIEDDATLQVSREELDGYINAFLDDDPADMLHIGNSCCLRKEYITSDTYTEPINRTKGDAHHADENCGCSKGGPCNGIPFYSSRFLRAVSTQTSSCYIIKKKVVKALLSCYFSDTDAIQALDITKDIPTDIGIIDTSWAAIIDKYIFLVPNVPPYGRLLVQRASYSDISRCFADYKI
jgi:GR25 family glycosyltransferase involved in LPS biosynthesis